MKEERKKKKEGMCKVTRIYGNQDTSDNECEYWNTRRERERGREGEREETEIIYEKRKILFLVSPHSDTQEKERGIN